jgi:hypothetical protein
MNIDMNEFNIEKPQSKLFDIDNLDLNNNPDLKVSVNKMNVNNLSNSNKISSPPRLFEISNIGIDLLENKNRKKSQSFSMEQDLSSLDLSKGDIDLNLNQELNLFDQLQKNDNSKDRFLKQKQEKSQDNFFKDMANKMNADLDNTKFNNNLPNLGKDTILDFNIDLSNTLNMDNANNAPLKNIDLSLDDLNQQFNNNLDPFQNISLDFSLNDPNNQNNNTQNNNTQNNNTQNNNNEPASQPQPKKVEIEKDDLDDLNIDELLSECDTLKNKHNIHVPSHFNRNSPLEEVKSFIRRERRKREKNNSEKLGAKILMTTITALEFLNNKFDPFELKLDGWSESVHENIDDYNDVFGELYEKYKTSTKVPPEIKLMMMVGGSAAMVHLTNTMFKSSLPGMEEMMKQNPDMMKQFAQAAMNQMGQSVPAGMFGQNQGSAASKPEPSQSQNNNQFNKMPQPPLNQHQFNRPPPEYPSTNKMRGPTLNPDLNFIQNNNQMPNQNVVGPRPQSSNQVKINQPQRREMTGPRGVDDILKELAGSVKPPTPKLTSPNGSMISKGTNNRRTINLNI